VHAGHLPADVPAHARRRDNPLKHLPPEL
jgi:hypothetical protein